MKPKRVHKLSSGAILNGESSFAMQESIVRLRTNFTYVTMNGEYKKIVFTSCQSGEGKSTLVINLASSLARAGKQVLVMDCDLRRSVISSYLRDSKEHRMGMSELLSCQAEVDDVIYSVPERGFDIIFSGDRAPNPSELIGSSRLAEILSRMEKYYEYILIDASPVLAVSDAVILSTMVDGVIFVAQQGTVTRKQVRAALGEMRANGARILGTVLNQYDVKRDFSTSARGSHYYDYYYRSEA